MDGRLFIRGKHHGVRRWVQVQPQHVRRLLLEVRVVGQHVALEAMRLQPGSAPHLRNQPMTDPHHLGEFARAPVRAAVGRRLPGLGQDAGFERGRAERRGLPTILRPQAGQPFALEPLFPSIDVIRETPHGRADGGERRTVGQHQNDRRPSGVLRANLPASSAAFQFVTFIGRQCQRHKCAAVYHY